MTDQIYSASGLHRNFQSGIYISVKNQVEYALHLVTCSCSCIDTALYQYVPRDIPLCPVRRGEGDRNVQATYMKITADVF